MTAQSRKNTYTMVWFFLSIIGLYLFLKFLSPSFFSIVDKTTYPLPMPNALILLLIILLFISWLLYVSSSERRLKSFTSFLILEEKWNLRYSIQLAIFITFPLIVAWLFYSATLRAPESHIELKIKEPELKEDLSKTANLLKEIPFEANEKYVEEGKVLYRIHCRSCHGLEGRGNGPDAEKLDPKPSDFTKAEFKIRSTPWGDLPSDEDLLRVITLGVPGTAMDSWSSLSEIERLQLISYIKTLNPRFAIESSPKTIQIPEDLPITPESIAHGEELFKRMQCFLCHGKEGRGDGPITKTLKYEWGFLFRARNLTKGWTYKAGNSQKEIYRSISTGFYGTPMGSYAEYLTEEERWHLASYVNSISGDEKPGARILIKPKLIKGILPESPEDPVFKEASAISIPLGGQIISRPEKETRMIDSMIMKSLYNNREIVFLFEWDDITGKQSKSFKDALTIQFLLNKNIGMKDSGYNINMWYWKALLDGSSSNIDDERNEKSLFREFNIRGENVLIQQSAHNQGLKGKSVWQNGKWKVMVKKSLYTDEEDDVQFKKGNLIHFALSVWDGTNGKFNAEKAISTWYYLMVGKPYHYREYIYSFLGLIIGASIEMLIIGRVRKKSFSKQI